MISLQALKSVRKPDEEDEGMLKALVVEDSKLDQLILKKILVGNGYDVCTVGDGHAAIEMFRKYDPDIIFMDLYLPDVTGYVITKSLKVMSEDKYVPIIFVTGETNDDALEQCLSSGGDDFIIKPIKESLLTAKADSLLRIKKMHDNLRREKEMISEYSASQEKDMHDANKIIDNIRGPLFYNPGNIKYTLEPQFIISGDMFCSSAGPSGNHVMLVGDNTGHGLPAAIGSLIIYDVFYTMVEKGFEIEAIAEEINYKLFRLLPSDRFFAATLVEIDSEYEIAKVWNAGMPAAFIVDSGGAVKKKIVSVNMPLGIKGLSRDEVKPEIIDINNDDRIYLYSDGLLEVFNTKGEQFSEDSMLDAFQTSNVEDWYDKILENSNKFRGDAEKTDDVLFVEVNCNKALVNMDDKVEMKHEEIEPMEWSFKLDLKGDAICQGNPITVSLESISVLQGLKNHHEKLFLILSEMYSNSVEHGLLGLSSAIKEEKDGFLKYYELRQAGLESIENETLSIEINNRIENEKGVLSILMEDSGCGFDYSQIEGGLLENNKKSGRGIGLIADLCNKYEYSNGGRTLKVEYEW